MALSGKFTAGYIILFHLFSGNMAHRKTKHRNTLIITSRQDRQKKTNYIYKLQANYINYTYTNTSFN